MAAKNSSDSAAQPMGVISGTKISFNDSVALVPLVVGFKPSSSRLFPLLEPFTEFKSPNASVLDQCWKPYNSAVYSDVQAAMKLCGVDMLTAISNEYASVDKKDDPNSATNKTALAKVFSKIAEIESKIIALMGNSDHKEMIKKNAKAHREDILNFFSGIYSDDVVPLREIMQKDAQKTFSTMQRYFKATAWNYTNWNGVDDFNQFWNEKVVKRDSKLGDRLMSQEGRLVDMFDHILNLNSEFYKNVQASINKNNLLDECRKLKVIANDAKKIENDNKVNSAIKDYFWALLVERFEMLNSMVSTYFALICNTRKLHNAIVERFMGYAIHACVSPIFSCKVQVESDSSGPLKERDQKINGCLTFYKNIDSSFNSCIGTFFDSSIQTTMVKDLNQTERSENRMNVSESMDKKSGDVDLIEKKSSELCLFLKIKKIFEEMFRGCENKKTSDFLSNNTKKSISNLRVVRDVPGANIKSSIFKGIRTTVINLDTQAQTLAKTIAYYKIYYNVPAFGFFHFKDFDKNTLIKQWQLTENPLIMTQSLSAIAENARAARTTSTTGVLAVELPVKGWNDFTKTKGTGDRYEYTRAISDKISKIDTLKSTLSTIFTKMELRDDFSADKGPKPQKNPSARPKSASRTKKAATSGKKTNQSKKDTKKNPSKKEPSKKPKDGKPNPKKTPKKKAQ